MEVGSNHNKRNVTELNHTLFVEAKVIMEKSTEKENACHHIGWIGVGDFIDWLEQNYNIVPKR